MLKRILISDLKLLIILIRFIPLEKDLIKKYDNARMKAKAFPSDKLLHDEFSVVFLKLMIKVLMFHVV